MSIVRIYYWVQRKNAMYIVAPVVVADALRPSKFIVVMPSIAGDKVVLDQTEAVRRSLLCYSRVRCWSQLYPNLARPQRFIKRVTQMGEISDFYFVWRQCTNINDALNMA